MATKKAAKEKTPKPVETKIEEPAYDKGPLVSFGEIADQLPDVEDLEMFESLCADYKAENDKAVEAEAAKEALKPAIKELAEKLGITHAGNEVMTFMKIKGKQPDRIVPEALLEMGVDMDTINAATKKGASYFYFQIIDSDAVKEARKKAKNGGAEDSLEKFAAVRAALTTLLTEGADFSIFITFDGIEHQFPPAVMKEHGERGYVKLFLGPVHGRGPWEVKKEFLNVEVSFYGKKTILDIPYENFSTIQMHKDQPPEIAVRAGLVMPPAVVVPGASGASPEDAGDTGRVITGPWARKGQ